MKATAHAILFSLFVSTLFAPGQTPEQFNYQGRLVDGNGPLSGQGPIIFGLFDIDKGGSPIYAETQTVSIIDGLYSVQIGASNSVPGSLMAACQNNPLYVSLNIGGKWLSPRERISCTPFALTAGNISSVDSQPLEFVVNNQRCFRAETTTYGIKTPNIILGFTNIYVDSICANITIGGGDKHMVGFGNEHVTIAGGYSNSVFFQTEGATISGGNGNTIKGHAYHAVIGGGRNNIIDGSCSYATISGGDNNSIAASASDASIGGGQNNTIGWMSYGATISGGNNNKIDLSCIRASIGGGQYNAISNSAYYAVIPGGYENKADGQYSFAAGRRAQAMHNGAFVWADSHDEDFISTASNQFLIAASGGVGIGTEEPTERLHVESTEASVGSFIQIETSHFADWGEAGFRIATPENKWHFRMDDDSANNIPDGALGLRLQSPGREVMTWYTNGTVGIRTGNWTPTNYLQVTANGAYCDGNQWYDVSDASRKEGFEPVDGASILEHLETLSITRWNYQTDDPSVKHLGPTAQDFYIAFGLGATDKAISSSDRSGVALAAAQELYRMVQNLEKQNQELRNRIELLDKKQP